MKEVQEDYLFLAPGWLCSLSFPPVASADIQVCHS